MRNAQITDGITMKYLTNHTLDELVFVSTFILTLMFLLSGCTTPRTVQALGEPCLLWQDVDMVLRPATNNPAEKCWYDTSVRKNAMIYEDWNGIEPKITFPSSNLSHNHRHGGYGPRH